ncbi:uncharacterized protein LOC129956928 [Argiope bruennichi]|uniref:uncharacterized protein LOC129956928 n=1 Tax=Argiope bruennichi TaxID=94029 RepID=UPI0024955006|nr:uncharacterized protein LOC129956928 [Argiope bruennichi]
MKEFYSLMNKKKLQMDNSDSNKLSQTAQDQNVTSDVHRRRKRDTQYAEGNDGPQQYWGNQGENENEQLLRAQRDVPSTSTEHEPTSTEGRTQRNADLQSSKQSKRSAEMEEDEADENDLVSPSPDEDYQDEEESDYQPEKRFAGPETTGTTPNYEDSSTKNPSQLYRREAMNPNYNYPFFANPGFYYPNQRLMSPYDGISYRSADAFPMLYMDAPAFWQNKVARSPRRFYSQRQAGGYGGGWPPMPSYYQQYGNRYQPSYPSPAQQPRGHYRHQSSYGGYKPFSYGYAQGKKAPARKPIETDAHMYYGK